jgi:hypothetical protein
MSIPFSSEIPSIKRIPVAADLLYRLGPVLRKRKHTVLLIAPAGDLAEAIKSHPDMEKRIKKSISRTNSGGQSSRKLCPNTAAYNVSENPAAAGLFFLSEPYSFCYCGEIAAYPLAVSGKILNRMILQECPDGSICIKRPLRVWHVLPVKGRCFPRVYNVPDNQMQNRLWTVFRCFQILRRRTWLTLICPQYFNPVISGKHR